MQFIHFPFTKDDAELIHKYLVVRINEDWTDLKNGK